jgi:hypothetical protein
MLGAAQFPATLLGRLAISREFKGGGVGELLLMGAQKEVSNTAGTLPRLRWWWTLSTKTRVLSTEAMASSMFRITRVGFSCS